MTQASMTTTPALFKPVYLDKRVSLTPSELRVAAGNMDEFLVAKIRDGLEGLCCAHGYVRPGSTTILGRSMGQAEHGLFTADFLYHCKVKVSCLMPHADQVVEGRVLKVNKSGAYVLLVENGELLEAMRILLPRDLHIGNSEFEGLQVGQGIRVRILRSRFQTNDAFIQAVGEYDGLAAAAEGGTDTSILKPPVPDTAALTSKKATTDTTVELPT
jgi:DNA-directed RNA polymerase subunit E'/Rpb7